MDLFFNEEEDGMGMGMGAEKVKCGVDEDGVLQCVTNSTDEVVWCEGEGTIKLAGCVVEGCEGAELVVVYV